MGKVFKYGFAAALVAGSFWACGDGEVIVSGSDEEVGLQQVLHNRVTVDDALSACMADSLGCKLAMENAPVSEVPKSSASEGSDATSSESAATSSPSTNVASSGSSDPDPVVVPVYPTSSSEESTRTSSQSSMAVKAVSGRCTVSPSSAEKKKDEVTYTFIQVGTAPTLETLDWTIPEDATLKTTIEGLTKTVTVTYANAGKPAAVTLVANKGLSSEGKVVTCAAPTIVGPAVTGCTCSKPTLTSTSGDLASASPVTYEWTVSGCSSVDAGGESAGPFTYSWSGTGVTGSSETGTGSFTVMGKYAATVTATNADGVSEKFTCAEKAEVLLDGASSCNEKNSTVLSRENTDNNKAEMDLIAGKCYSYQFANRNYAAKMQVGNWTGSTVVINVTGCDGTEHKDIEVPSNNQFTAVDGGFTGSGVCIAYIQTNSNAKLQFNNW